MSRAPSDAIALMVLTKGFRVSQDTEEFQLVWPPSVKALAYETERRLVSHDAWPAVLQALYGMPPADVLALPCVLLSPSSATSISVGVARDRYSRPMVVAVGATASISWGSSDDEDAVSTTVAQIVGSGRFAADRLARQFDGNPRDVAAELRAEKFDFSLADFRGPAPGELRFWNAVIRSARDWRNISGLGSPPLLALGANVLLGTEHEAMRFVSTGGSRIDGYFEPTRGRIVPTSSVLTLWNQHWRPKEESVSIPIAPVQPVALTGLNSQEQPAAWVPSHSISYERLESIDNSIKSIDKNIESVTKKGITFLDLGITFLQAGMEFWFGRREKRDKR